MEGGGTEGFIDGLREDWIDEKVGRWRGGGRRKVGRGKKKGG